MQILPPGSAVVELLIGGENNALIQLHWELADVEHAQLGTPTDISDVMTGLARTIGSAADLLDDLP